MRSMVSRLYFVTMACRRGVCPAFTAASIPLRISSKDPKAYQYLYDSVQAFPDFKEFTDIMELTGYHSNNFRPLTLGICSIYSGIK